MKKNFHNIKFIAISTLVALAFLASPKESFATFFYTTHDIPYIVNAAGTIPPVADAGADQNITLPTSTTTIDGSGSYDPDGTITNYVWTKTLGSGNIMQTNSAITGITGLTSGTSTFCLSVIDNDNLADTDCMNIYVSAAGNIAPTAYAGPDQTIVVPSNAASVSGSGYDPDGTIVSYTWSQTAGPTTATIVSPSAANTSIIGMTSVGTYTFNLRVYDNDGAFGDDQMDIIVSTTPPVVVTASLWASPNVLPSGGGNTTLTWHSTNATTCTSIDFATGGLVSNSPVYGTGNGVSVSLTSTTTYHIRCSGANAQATVTVSPKDTPINGLCSATHFLCQAGSSSNNAGTGPWTWDCVGSGGGTTASCSESLGGGDPQCSDGVDNDDPEDTLVDDQDPGCHSDKDPNNIGSYLPNKDSERNTPKIKEIEI